MELNTEKFITENDCGVPGFDAELFLHDLKGDDVQKLSVIQALPNLLQVDSQAVLSRVLPKIQQQLSTASCEIHVASSKTFTILVERKIPVSLLNSVLQGIDSRDPIVSNAWVDTLLHVIPTLNENQIKNEIIPLAVNKAHLHHPVVSRVGSCKILGKVAVHPKLQALDVKKDVLPITQSLCQDCNHEVRATMCSQLPSIAQALGSSLLKTNLLPSLVELAADDNAAVRSAAITTIVHMFQYFNQETMKSTILPLVKQLCERSIEKPDVTSTMIAKEFGKILEGLQPCLSMAESLWFLDCYNTLAHRGLASTGGDIFRGDASQDVMCRQHCAYNLPAMTHFVLSEIAAHLDVFYTIFRTLAADPCYIVRRTVASSIHEVAKILGTQNKIIKVDVVRLLRDDAEEVLQMLVPHIGLTLESFCIFGTLSKESASHATLEVGRALLKCQVELAKGTNWRLLTHFLHQMEHLPNCMPADFIHQHFTPNIMNIAVAGRARPVRSQAARTLLIFLKYNTRETQRKWLKENLINQLCYSKSCYTRHIFIRLCKHALDIFSDKYFKEHFFSPLISLADDPVSNIRLCVVSLFPNLKQMLILSDDKKLKSSLDSAITRMEAIEKDRDVLQCLKGKIKEMNAQTVQNKDERLQEEKRRIQEEEDVIYNRQVPSVQQSSTVNRRPSSTTGSPGTFLPKTTTRSLSVPPKKQTTAQAPVNDMTFLEQHFYIDAGISLPKETIRLELIGNANEDLKKQGTNELTLCSIDDSQSLQAPVNATDDIKVNLQKMVLQSSTSGNKNVLRNKRHSSVLSFKCIENQERKSLNRRSLNMSSSKDMSRIPISLKCLQKQKNINSNGNDGEYLAKKEHPLRENNNIINNADVTLTKLSDILNDSCDNKGGDCARKYNMESSSLSKCSSASSAVDNSFKSNVVRKTDGKKKTSHLPVPIK